jgi:hypothetical protein
VKSPGIAFVVASALAATEVTPGGVFRNMRISPINAQNDSFFAPKTVQSNGLQKYFHTFLASDANLQSSFETDWFSATAVCTNPDLDLAANSSALRK